MKSFFPLLTDILQVTHAGAVASFDHIGSGNRELADQVAVNAMRQAFQNVPIKGKVVIGEGERDSAPMLHIGEKVGMWEKDQKEWDIAVDPLEGTNLCANAIGGAISVLALSEKGSLFNAPDIYMEKIACGPSAKGAISLSQSIEDNLKSVSKALDKNISDVTVAVLDRLRHQRLIQSIYALGARVHLITDGDLSASILTAWNGEEQGNTSVDLMIGIGGSPEGVLAASALKCLGGDFQGRLIFQNKEEKKRAMDMGVTDPINTIYKLDELVKSPVIFCATGVTSGSLLKGVMKKQGKMETESLYMSSGTKECVKLRVSK